MLNISPNSVKNVVELDNYDCFHQSALSSANRMFTRWLVALMLIVLIMMFLPWTQNIQTEGQLTTLQPGQRPQTINSTIAGRIEKWYVREGQLVEKGDTIAFLSEIKADYFDPQLVARTENQVKAKQSAIGSYDQKVNALENQVKAMREELKFKQSQIQNKIRQTELKLESQKAAVEQAKIDAEIAEFQLKRTDTLFQKGIKSLTDLESKRLKVQEVNAKLIAATNKLAESENEVNIAKLNVSTIKNEYANKIAKAESDKFSTLSTRFDAEGSVNKLQSQAENYFRRSGFYYITAPQRCFINEALKPGIGETVKEGEAIVDIMPADFELAVELFVRPMDLPLVQHGQEVRFLFDGWPAVVFSGWPGLSFGTYHGHIAAIDNNISKNGRYRILVSPHNEKPWPEALRVGSGAKGIALLNDVPVWYELWRQLNGFPPDFYESADEKTKEPKLKAPVKAMK